MFKKLASNLPFNPGLIQQVTFYGKRLHREESLRRVSFVLMGLTLVINIIAISFPAQNTYAGSDSNIMVNGGASTKEGILQKYDQDPFVQAAYASFGIYRQHIEKMVLTTINTKADWAQPLVTAGRRPNGSNGEYPLNTGGGTIYVHSLDSAFSANTIDALVCEASSCGRYLAIAIGCGNPINSVNETPPPDTEPTAPLEPNGYVDGTNCTSIFGWAYNNNFPRYVHIYIDKPAFGGATPGVDYYEVSATQDTRADVATVFPGYPSSVGWSWDGGPLRNDGKEHSVWAYVTDRAENYALLSGGDGVRVNFNCPVPLEIATCPGGPLAGQLAPDNNLANCPASPVANCAKLTILSNAVQKDTDARFVITATALNDAAITGYRFDFGDGESETFSTNSGSLEVNHKYVNVGNYTVKVTTLTSEGEKTSPDCEGAVEVKPQPVPCPHDATLLFSDSERCNPCPENPILPASNTELCTAIKVLSKKVANITKGLADANGTEASPGDTLEYTLITQNTAKKLDVKHTTKENIADLLDYSETTELSGGRVDSDKNLIWDEVTIVAGESLKQVFRVQIKSVIPSTPPSTTDAGTFDLKMVNVYGNSTTVELPCPTSLCVKGSVERLPNTGPGSSLVLTFVTVCLIGFFYMRSRILAKEIDIIKYDYSKGV